MFKQWIISLAMGIASKWLQSLGMPDATQFMVALGRAFGPDGCRHYSELSPTERAALLLRAPVLGENHRDWPKPFQWVPRLVTAYVMPNDQPPPIIAGTGSVEDIPAPGTWVATRGYVAVTTRSKEHARFGWRWNVNDKYLEFPAITIKHLK